MASTLVDCVGLLRERDALGTQGRDALATFDERIPQVPEMPLHGFMLDFIVGQYRLRGRVPVDQPFTAIDQPILEELEERAANGFDAHVVHGEPRSRPVARAAHRLQLTDNAGFIFVFPRLNPRDEFVSLEVGPAFAFFREDSLFHDRLCGDARVVGPRHPQGIVILHPAKADQDVLKGVIQGVAEMQRRRDVGRRDDDRVTLSVVTRMRFGVEVRMRRPYFVCLSLDCFRLVCFRELFAHTLSV